MRFPSSVRRRYERQPDGPAGFIALGDALCCFNPVYGQGMAVAAAQGRRLRELLADGPGDLAPRFFRAAAEIVDGPWALLLASDLRFPDADGSRTAEIERGYPYMDAFRAAAADDGVLATALIRVLNLLDPPSRLRDQTLRDRVERSLAASLPRD
jgi:2-polyprenyl-6-methoxyphenol hydroxylase-like FAD-dependent oxidoreductase